jgi:hypothetical protein
LFLALEENKSSDHNRFLTSFLLAILERTSIVRECCHGQPCGYCLRHSPMHPRTKPKVQQGHSVQGE